MYARVLAGHVGAVEAVDEATKLCTVAQCLHFLHRLHEVGVVTLERDLSDEVYCCVGHLTVEGRYTDPDVFNLEDPVVDHILPQQYAEDPVWPAGRVPCLLVCCRGPWWSWCMGAWAERRSGPVFAALWLVPWLPVSTAGPCRLGRIWGLVV